MLDTVITSLVDADKPRLADATTTTRTSWVARLENKEASPMAMAQVGDVELYYEEYGEGPPVVLIHGLAGDCSAWQAQIARLERS
jgi:hypothetical protein